MPTLREIVEKSDTRSGRAFDLSIQTLIVFSLVSFSIETLPNIPAPARPWLHGFEIFCVVVFTIEYILRAALARPHRRYILSFFGIIDLAAILPFYLASGFDLRSIRAFRLLRLFRIFKLARYSRAVRRFHCALIIAREELVLYFVASMILLYLASVGIYYCEHEAQPEAFSSVFDGIWWAIVTLTTVGYGDVYPITAGGRIFTFVVLVIGLGIVAVPAGLVASALGKARELEERK